MGMLMITQEKLDRVEEIIGDAFRERFADKLVFDPIVVEPAADEGDNNYLHITIVFEGDRRRLDPGWTIMLVRQVREKLLSEGINEFPVTGYVKRSEWDRWQRQDKLRAERKKLSERRKNRVT